MALPRTQRLTNRADFLRISQQGKTVGDDFFLLRYTPGAVTNNRVAIVISRKAIPLATKRNQLRRIISAWLAEYWCLDTSRPTDLVIGVKADCAKLKSNQIKISLEQLFRKANLV